jgi:hypothetical protein
MRVVNGGQVLDAGALFSQCKADMVEFALESQRRQGRQYSSRIDENTIARTRYTVIRVEETAFFTRVAYLALGLEQALLSDAIALYQDTRPAIKHLVLESIRVNVAFHSVILCSRLQPKRRDI